MLLGVDWPIVGSFVAGATVAGVLSNVKSLVELYRLVLPPQERRNIAIQSHLVSHSEVGGNRITLTNLSDRVALLSYWEVVRRRPGLILSREESIAFSEDSPTKRIETDTEVALVFDDERWFNPWRKDRPGWQIVFRYIITGERVKEVILTRG